MPSESNLGLKVRDNNDGTICIQYEPRKAGMHEVQMSYEGDNVDGSPFSCVVDSVDGSFVTAFGSGLVGGRSGVKESFTVVAKQGHAKDIGIGIEGPSKTDMERKDNPDGSTNVTFMPMTPGAYNINIKYNGKHIKGSPYVCKVSGEGRKRSQLSLSNSSEYSLGVIEADTSDLHATLKTPSGHSEPIILRKMTDGELGVASFNPKELGKYSVHVIRGEKGINNSPFAINVTDKELGHAARVVVTGATSEAFANKQNEVVIDTTKAGYGGLSIALEGPHRSDITCVEAKDRVYKIHYSPHEPGIYILNIRFADDHVPGSAFLVNVGGDPSGRSRETVNHAMEAAKAVQPKDRCEFILQIPGTNPFDMEASVTDPEGKTELCEVVDQDDFHYLINFAPEIKGLHILSIKHKGLHISGSPFQYSVGQLSLGGYHKVQVGGPGLERGEVNVKNVFNIYTREAGPGTLSVAVEGPSKANIKLEERPNGFLGCHYRVEKPGMYGVHIKFEDQHIPGSPFMVNISPDSGMTRQVTVAALKDRGVAGKGNQVDKPMTFTVALNGAKGTLHTSVRTPSGRHDDCFMQEMDDGIYAVRYIPRENGVHYIDVKLDDTHIPDSPFAVLVGSMAADPAMVHAVGDGLENAKANQKAKFTVRTAGAGSGLLAVTMEGPSKVALSCLEVDEGYEFSYTAFCPGKYLIIIKYGNIPIAGSPHQTTVTGSGRKPSPINEQSSMIVETVEKKPGASSMRKFHGDASKVVAKGPGLKKAFTNRVQNVTLEVKDAGAALLSVGMISPSGQPEAELSVKPASKTTYTLSYKVVEIGEHFLHILWGDEHIPGSPFSLHT